jgi:hypothetical protein
MHRVMSVLLVASLQGCFWVSGTDEEDRLADRDQDGFPDLDDCAPTVPGEVNGSSFYRDADADGSGNPSDDTIACTAPEGYVDDDLDCDDTNGTVHPGATDGCNGLDDDCDGAKDESPSVAWFIDGDSDGFGGGEPYYSCTRPGLEYTTAGDDCNDANAQVNPDAAVVCEPVDNNCDGLLDNADADDDGFPGCLECDDASKDVFPGANESCNGADDDCDGTVDEDATDATKWYADADADTHGDPEASLTSCATTLPGYATADDDCDDGDSAIHPGAAETCDGIDQDCDGDESTATDAETFYVDADLDGYGDALGATKQGCTEPVGYARFIGDCNDADAAFNPGALETDCGDANDYNCDGNVGQVDNDGDEFFACQECDDTDPAINPSAAEACNLVDDDCDGKVDEGAAVGATPWYEDVDADGYGNPASQQTTCVRPAGWLADATDCDDAAAAVHPGAAETCASPLDDDCDGTIDESDAYDASTFYADADADTFGNVLITKVACKAPIGFVAAGTDCNDSAASVNPGATEQCDPANTDEDCDKLADNNDSSAVGTAKFYADADADTYGDKAASKTACDAPTNYVGNDQDCNDGDAKYNPGATELCTDTLDYNCDGAVGAKDADGDTHIACEECDDGDAKVYPGAPEVAGDKIDQDCDGVDSCYKDGDLDGFGAGALVDSKDLTCSAGLSGVATDCDDADAADRPGATEVVGNEDDEDCDGAELCYVDGDDDGYGLTTTTKSTTTTCGTKLATKAGDCDDADNKDYPTAPETVANGDDEDCDGREVCYTDLDLDKYGVTTTVQSTDPDCADSGEAVNATDCDDRDAGDNPGATEITANNDDENCDKLESCWVDGDVDSWGGTSTKNIATFSCITVGTSFRTGDCNDGDKAVNPSATEGIGDKKDQNCDTYESCFADSDDDDLRHAKNTVLSGDLDCDDALEAYAAATIDCNDLVPNGDVDGNGVADCSDPVCPRWVDALANTVIMPCGTSSGPCKQIKPAIANRGSCTAIFVKPGTYTETNLDYGGVDLLVSSTEGALTTIVDAKGGPGVVFENNETSAAVLQGFTIQNGRGKAPKVGSPLPANTRHGGGLYVDRASPTIAYNILRNNDLTSGTGAGGIGGGAVFYGSSSLVVGNVMTGNKAPLGGGGAAVLASTAYIAANEIRQNSGVLSQADGLAVVSDGSIYQGNAIYDNGAFNNLYVGASASIFLHNLVVVSKVAAVRVDGADASVFVNNTIDGATNSVEFLADEADGALPTSTFVNNQITHADSCGVTGPYDDATFTTNNIYAKSGNHICGAAPFDASNTYQDVTYDGSWSLVVGSGGIDLGTNMWTTLNNDDDFDQAGIRPHTGAWDMGAQEGAVSPPPTGL